jgi:hypothetical protein
MTAAHGSKTMQGLEYNLIDLISAAILLCEDGRVEDMRKRLMDAIGIAVEMRILHDRMMTDHESGEPKPRDGL